jgi:hypothetical protein
MPSSYVESHIRGLGDEDLAAYIATGTAVYEPEAVEFARQELARRGLTTAQATEAVTRASARHTADKAADSKFANESLQTWEFVLYSGLFVVDIIGLPLVLIMWANFRQRGARKKSGQIWWCYLIAKLTCFGLLFALLASGLLHLALRK